MRWFLTLFVGSVVTLGMIYLLVQQWGRLQTYEAYTHPFFEALPAGTKAEVFSQAAPAEEWPSKVAWVDLRVSLDHVLFQTQTPLTRERMDELMQAWPNYHGPKPYFYTFADIKKFFPEARPFTDLCQEIQPLRWILNIVDNAQDVHLATMSAIEACRLQDKALIQSTTTAILSSLRKEKPRWLFGFSLADLNRLVSFSSVGLGSVATIKGDVFVSPITVLGRKILDRDVLEEVHRRKMKIVLGPLANEADLKFVTENQLPFDLLVQSR